MRGNSPDQAKSPEPYKMTIPVSIQTYLSLEGWSGGRDRTLYPGVLGMGREAYSKEPLHAGDEIRLTLDLERYADPERALKELGGMLAALPTYDLVGVIDEVEFDA